MTAKESTAILLQYLQGAREAVLWKLDGLSEYDVRRPVTPTGTNLLGLVKHLVSVESDYLGAVFGRPFAEPVPWADPDAEPNTDMWATPDESREYITGLYRRVWAHGDATVAELGPDAVGHVWWWPEERREVTVFRVLVHLVAETDRHAGHADLVREAIDGAAGLGQGNDNLPAVGQGWWEEYRDRVERAAREAGAAAGGGGSSER